MPELRDRHGREKTVGRDPETGREVWRMTDSPAHDLHSYYDTCSWSPDGSRIAFTSILPQDVVLDKLASTPKGHLFVMNADGGDIECVAEAVAFELHTGCLPMWKDDRTILFRGQRPEGTEYSGMVDLETGEITEIPGLLARNLSPDASEVVCQWEQIGRAHV